VLVYVKVFVIGAVMREPMNQTGIDVAVAGTGPQPRFEEQDRASQITARLLSATGNLITRCAWIFRRVSLAATTQ